MHIPSWLRIVVVVAAICLQPITASAAPQVGWWWNASESGRGFFIESQNGIVYLAGYFYESDGRATWLVSGGANGDPYSYSGRLLGYRGGQTLFGDYQPPAAPTDAGAVSLSFSDDTHGTLTWPGGTIAIERQRFGGTTDDVTPDSGWWWNDQESGRGYSVEVQGDSIFIVAFMYDDAGNPLWYYSAGKMASDTDYTEYQGPWLQFANGQTLTGPYHPPTVPVPVGQLSVEFTGIDEATFEFDDLVATTARAQPQAGRSRVIEVKREFKATPTYKPAPRYAGVFNWKSVSMFESAINGVKVTSTITIVVTGNLVWDQEELPPLPKEGGLRFPVSYTLAPDSSATLTYTQTQVGGDSNCQAAFSEALHDAGSELDVNVYAEYRGKVKFSDPSTTTFDLVCKFDDGTEDHTPVPVIFQPEFDISGMAKKASLTKKLKPVHPVPEITVTGNWTFAAITP